MTEIVTESERPRAARWIWGAVIVLAVLHWDFWFWSDRTLVLGFLPIGLFYHALFSIACGILWGLAGRHAWPHELEEWASETDETKVAP